MRRFIFSRGVALEAEVLARHLAESGQAGRAGRIVQVFRDNDAGRVPAQILRAALQRCGSKMLLTSIARRAACARRILLAASQSKRDGCADPLARR